MKEKLNAIIQKHGFRLALYGAGVVLLFSLLGFVFSSVSGEVQGYQDLRKAVDDAIQKRERPDLAPVQTLGTHEGVWRAIPVEETFATVAFNYPSEKAPVRVSLELHGVTGLAARYDKEKHVVALSWEPDPRTNISNYRWRVFREGAGEGERALLSPEGGLEPGTTTASDENPPKGPAEARYLVEAYTTEKIQVPPAGSDGIAVTPPTSIAVDIPEEKTAVIADTPPVKEKKALYPPAWFTGNASTKGGIKVSWKKSEKTTVQYFKWRIRRETVGGGPSMLLTPDGLDSSETTFQDFAITHDDLTYTYAITAFTDEKAENLKERDGIWETPVLVTTVRFLVPPTLVYLRPEPGFRKARIEVHMLFNLTPARNMANGEDPRWVWLKHPFVVGPDETVGKGVKVPLITFRRSSDRDYLRKIRVDELNFKTSFSLVKVRKMEQSIVLQDDYDATESEVKQDEANGPRLADEDMPEGRDTPRTPSPGSEGGAGTPREVDDLGGE